MTDVAVVSVLWALVLAWAAAYALRVAVRGRARNDRADKDGGSALLSMHLVEFCLWSMVPFARLLARAGVTPDGVTWFSLAPGLAAGVALAFGRFGLAAVLGTVSAFCDTIDGLIARQLSAGSRAGETLDSVADRYVESAFFGGLIVYYRFAPAVMVLAILALIGAFMISYTTAKAEAQRVSLPRGLMRRTERSFYLMVAAGLVPFTRMLVPLSQPVYVRDVSMVAVIALIAVVGNISAVSRTFLVRRTLSAPVSGPVSAPATGGASAGSDSPQLQVPADSRG